MDTTFAILLLLLAVVTSSLIARAAPLPLPVVQIALGAFIAATLDISIVLDPGLFLLLFIAPLLFLDGWRMPKEGLIRDRRTICALAFGLVFFTVAGAGLFIHWMVPAMPMAIAIALAAVLSPTDAVAVSAIAVRSPIPRRLLHILEGEALLNDASGLVCLRFAVAAALTGTFSILEASATFVWLAAGGVTVGTGVAWLANTAKDWTASHFGDDTGAQILISLLLPFGAYLAAEQVHASGILASVSAGIAMSHEERAGRASAVTRLRRAAVWDAVQFTGNGVIFVLLGQSLPGIIAGARQALAATGHQAPGWILLYAGAITVVLAVLRAGWAWMTLRLMLFGGAGRETEIRTPGWRLVGATTLAGARGALTLSGVMTLPLTLQGGATFPTRDLAILLAAGVIVLSLAAANIGLPLVLKGLTLPPEPRRRQEEDDARRAATEAAITAVEEALRSTAADARQDALRREAGDRLLAHYRQRSAPPQGDGSDADRARETEEFERALQVSALRAERDIILGLARADRVTDETARTLIRELDLQESRLGAS